MGYKGESVPKRKFTALVVLALGGGVIYSPAAWANSGHDHDRFKLTADITDVEKDDNGKDGPSEGDVYTLEFDLSDHDGDAGDGDGTCELVKVDRQDREFEADCEGTLDLDDGKLELEGTITDDDFDDRKVVLEVVDGTGDYEDAEGTATFEPAGDHHDRDRHGDYHGNHDGRDNGPDFKIEVDLD